MGKRDDFIAEKEDDYSRKTSSSFLNVNVPERISIFVCAPRGAGKSRNALSISTAFGLKRIVDEWIIGNAIPDTETLVLTTESKVDLETYLDPKFKVYTFREAMKVVRPNG